MSHKTSHRVTQQTPSSLECPLASLGRTSNNVIDTINGHHHPPPYHHPLSSSPLDPQVYQMSRHSPVLSIAADDIIYTSSVSQDNNAVSALIHDLDDDNAALSASSITAQNRGRVPQMFHNSSNSSQSSFEQSLSLPSKKSNLDYNRRYHATVPNRSQQNHETQQQQRNLLSLEFERLMQYGSAGRSENSTATSTYLKRTCGNGHNSEDSSESVPVRNSRHRNLSNMNSSNAGEEDTSSTYYLEKKMDDLYLGSALRGLPLGSESNHFQHEPRYYREFNQNNHVQGIHHRASSPSETSGSDRYLLNRTSSPANAFSSSNNNTSTSNLALDQQQQQQQSQPQSQQQIQQQSYHLNKKMKNLSENFCNIGRFSPSLDQGYATLVSPSPTTGHHSNTITTHSIVHHPPANTVIHKNTHAANLTASTRCRRALDVVDSSRLPPWNKKGPFRSGPYFERLPDDVVLQIFKWVNSCELCNVARVCRRFEQLAWRPILWKVINLNGEHLNGDQTLKMILRQLCGQSHNGACNEVERVLLSDGCRITDKGLQLLMRRCPELTHLQLHYCLNISNQALIDVLTKCTNLQHLDVTGCSQINCISPNPNLEPPRRLLLQYLDLTDCLVIDDVGVEILVKYCPQLLYLYLRRCVQITDAGLKFVPSFCISLKELSVSDCANVTDFGLYELAKLGAALRYLSVAKCDRVSDAGLKVIARRCYKLRYLNARGCEAVSDDSITVLAHSCPRLRALDIGKCDVSDAGLRALAESCPNLKKLSLRNCDMITDRGVQCVAYYCRGLQQLNIQDCPISIEGYRAVKKYCRRCIIEHTNPGFC